MVIDPSTPIGKLRLRVADYGDLPLLPDAVYAQALIDSNGNLPRAVKDVACMILGLLSFKTHRKLAQLEVWGAEAFKNYKEFLLLTVKDPAFMQMAPIPYVNTGTEHPLISFAKDWNNSFAKFNSSTTYTTYTF